MTLPHRYLISALTHPSTTHIQLPHTSPYLTVTLTVTCLSGKRTNTALEGFGAKRVYDYGEGDDSGTMEEDFAAWQTQVITTHLDLT